MPYTLQMFLSTESRTQASIRCLRAPSSWRPPHGSLIERASEISALFEAEAWDRFRQSMCKYKAFTNLSMIDRLALDWLQRHKYTVLMDDKGTALIPIKQEDFLSLKREICGDNSTFEPAECDRLHLRPKLSMILDQLDSRFTPSATLQFLKAQLDAEWRVIEVGMTWKSHKVVQDSDSHGSVCPASLGTCS